MLGFKKVAVEIIFFYIERYLWALNSGGRAGDQEKGFYRASP